VIRVLVAEDEPPILRAVKSLIEQTNPSFSVTGTASDGAMAVELLEKESFDVVFTDIRMPVMDGLALLDYIQNCHPSIFSVVLSGYNEFEYARQALQSRAFDYLLKPVSPDTLSKVLEKLELNINSRMKAVKTKQLSHSINKSVGEAVGKDIGDDCKPYAVMLLCAGPFLYYDGDFLSPGIAFWESIDFNAIVATTLPLAASFWTFQGETPADKIVVAELADSIDAQSIIYEIFEQTIKNTDIPITTVGYSYPVGFQSVNKAYKALRSRLLSTIKIGVSTIAWADNCQEKGHTKQELYSSDAAQKMTTALRSGEAKAIDENLCDALLWLERQDCTQQDVSHFFEAVFDAYEKEKAVLQVASKEWRRDLVEAISASVTATMLHGNLLSVFLAMGVQARQDKAVVSRIPPIIGRVQAYLMANYRESITNLTLSQEFGFVPSYISRLFREHTGLSTSDYLIKLRMDKAKELMAKDPDIMVKEVADQVGFKNQYHFSKTFKKQTGIWPTDFRRT
jgi:two-component system, response regulator YesN